MNKRAQPHVFTKYRSIAVALSFVIMAASSANAETLEQAWEKALKNNPGIAAQRASLRMVEEQVSMAHSGWRPNVSLTASAGKSYDKTPGNMMLPEDSALTPRNYGVEVVQPLFRGFRTVSEIDAAKKQADAQKAMLKSAEQQLLLNVAAAYLDVLRDKEVVALNAHNKEVLERQRTETQKRFELGEVTKTDVLQAQSREQGAATALVQAQGQLENSRAAYMRFVGSDAEDMKAPEAASDKPMELTEVVEKAVTKNPAIIAASYAKESADSDYDKSKGNFLPELNLVGSASRGWEQSQFVDGRQDNARIMLQLKVPLYQAGTEYARLRTASNQATAKRLEMEDVRLAVRQNATAAWQALTTARSSVVSTAAQVDASELALDGVRKESHAGTRTTLDVLNAEQELLAAKVALVQAKRNESLAYLQVKAAVGDLTADAVSRKIEE